MPIVTVIESWQANLTAEPARSYTNQEGKIIHFEAREARLASFALVKSEDEQTLAVDLDLKLNGNQPVKPGERILISCKDWPERPIRASVQRVLSPAPKNGMK